MNLKLLNQTLDERKVNLSDLAAKMGISRTSLYNKLEGKSPLVVPEMNTIRAVLRLTEEESKRIFWDN